jgi:hypothetical protein
MAMTLAGRIAVCAIGAGAIEPGETDCGVSSIMPPVRGVICLEPEHADKATLKTSAENT